LSEDFQLNAILRVFQDENFTLSSSKNILISFMTFLTGYDQWRFWIDKSEGGTVGPRKKFGASINISLAWCFPL